VCQSFYLPLGIMSEHGEKFETRRGSNQRRSCVKNLKVKVMAREVVVCEEQNEKARNVDRRAGTGENMLK
jgi:hypothetical protein